MYYKITNMTFEKYYSSILWLESKVVLPSGKRVSKEGFITKEGFDQEGFKKKLHDIYLMENGILNDQHYYE